MLLLSTAIQPNFQPQTTHHHVSFTISRSFHHDHPDSSCDRRVHMESKTRNPYVIRPAHVCHPAHNNDVDVLRSGCGRICRPPHSNLCSARAHLPPRRVPVHTMSMAPREIGAPASTPQNQPQSHLTGAADFLSVKLT